MNQTSAEKLSELLADGLEMGWNRQRTDEELQSFINSRHQALSSTVLQ